MELWIRTQDRQMLIKVFEVRLNWSNDTEIIVNSYTSDCCDYDYRGVGTYKTKERALEVLDEMQKKINLINLGHDFGSPMIDLENPTYIYEMPKE